MGEKVILNKEQDLALYDLLGKDYRGGILTSHIKFPNCWDGRYVSLNELSIEQMAIALYVGYEVEETPEEKLLNVWQSTWDEYNRITDFQNRPGGGYENGFAKGIEKAIDILGIQIKGINK